MALIVPPTALTWPYRCRTFPARSVHASANEFPRCFHCDLIRHYQLAVIIVWWTMHRPIDDRMNEAVVCPRNEQRSARRSDRLMHKRDFHLGKMSFSFRRFPCPCLWIDWQANRLRLKTIGHETATEMHWFIPLSKRSMLHRNLEEPFSWLGIDPGEPCRFRNNGPVVFFTLHELNHCRI